MEYLVVEHKDKFPTRGEAWAWVDTNGDPNQSYEVLQEPRFERAVLVYQGGIANIFRVSSFNLSDYGRDAFRLWQGDFRTAHVYALALRDAGIKVKACACNRAGDISKETWTIDLESQPFSDHFLTVSDTNEVL